MPELLPWPVREVGWWIVAGISFEEAHRRLDRDLRWPIANRRWATLLGRDIQVRFPNSNLAELRHRRWVPTDDGLRVISRLHDIGCRPDHFRSSTARHWASAAGGSVERGLELLQDWVEMIQQGPENKLWKPADHALRWLAFGIDIQEAQDWLQVAGADAYDAVTWRRHGFTPFGASLWRTDGKTVYPHEVRELHLQLYGETNGLGPKRKYRKPYKWMAPKTRQEKSEERSERWAERWDILKWNLRGRPG